jgi:hypothetical protein
VVTLDGPPQGDVDLYMRKEQPVADTGFFNPYIADYVSQGSTPHESIYVGPTSANPLIPGTYYIAMSNCASDSAAFTVSARVMTPTSTAKVEELSTDNGIVEDYYNNGSAGVYPPSGVMELWL